ncbi:hypothetical protein BGZ63DRAFT_135659 [Mariannaea sp. PMI_226]|nr:hypothetical protein BGZ63DRAFT_135659 [Mariannaea sp. PMI_226]
MASFHPTAGPQMGNNPMPSQPSQHRKNPREAPLSKATRRTRRERRTAVVPHDHETGLFAPGAERHNPPLQAPQSQVATFAGGPIQFQHNQDAGDFQKGQHDIGFTGTFEQPLGQEQAGEDIFGTFLFPTPQPDPQNPIPETDSDGTNALILKILDGLDTRMTKLEQKYGVASTFSLPSQPSCVANLYTELTWWRKSKSFFAWKSLRTFRALSLYLG